MDETFLLSNMSPQVALGFNRGYWAYLEHFVRSLTSTFDDVYVFTGPLYLPKLEDDGKMYVKYQVLGSNTAVPTHFYKVILGVKGKSYTTGAFLLPNEAIYDEKLSDFVVPISVIEQSSGLSFFPDLDARAGELCSKVTCQLSQSFKDAMSKKVE